MTPANLRDAREALKLTQEGFAEAVAVCTRTVSRWETGASPIPVWVELILKASGYRAPLP
jgi:DNA-binding transcriptional regulator YiaG